MKKCGLETLAYRLLDAPVVGERSAFQLRVDELVVDADLEATPVGGEQRQFLDLLLELLDEMVRQTDGLGLVPSGRAILNADSHSTPPFWQTPFALGAAVTRRLRDAVPVASGRRSPAPSGRGS